MADALVTGATGFIGAHLAAALLRRGDRVRCLVRSTSNTDQIRSLGAELVFGDLNEPASVSAAVADASVVYHLGGVVAARTARGYYRTNQQGTENLLRACARQKQPATVIVVSSVAAAGPNRTGQPRREEQPCEPVSHYGASKRAAELVAESFADALPITILRPAIVFGPGDRNVLEMFAWVQRGWHFVPGSLEHRYSLLYVHDCVAAIVHAAERGRRLGKSRSNEQAGDGYYFLACDETPTYAELGGMIANAMSCSSPRTTRMPVPVCIAAAFVSELVGWMRRSPNVFNRDKIREATAGSWTCCSDRAKSDLGFAAPLSLAQTLGETGRWYRENGWL